jgi:hypothetical protein
MHRMAILAVAGLIALLALATQLLLPRFIERRVEQKLTQHGGHARVHLSAFPSLRLLRKEGDSLTVRATGLVTPPPDPASSNASLQDLDGFGSVDIQVIGTRMGPLTISRLTVKRAADGEPYTVHVQATVTGADLATYAGGQLGGGIGGLLGGLAGAATPGASVAIPLDVTASLRSGNGGVRASNVTGSVAGLPAGPLVEALTAALAARF